MMLSNHFSTSLNTQKDPLASSTRNADLGGRFKVFLPPPNLGERRSNLTVAYVFRMGGSTTNR